MPVLGIASDHGGFELKTVLKKALEEWGVAYEDLGCFSIQSCDYPDIAHQLAEAIESGRFESGVLVCGTGIGVSMAANRHRGVRAALCTDPYMARMARQHNNANLLCLGGRVVGDGLGRDILRAFLDARFEGGRHERRVAKIDPT